VLPRYQGDIPQYSMALMAYTVNTYTATSGNCIDQVGVNLNIHFGVVLHEPISEFADEELGNEEGDMRDD
jgi:hypothetical protein